MKKKSRAGSSRSDVDDERRHLKYYMFDWDDNRLHMPTKIHLEKKTARGWRSRDVSTAEFARIRRDTVNYRPLGGDWDRALVDFYDVGSRGLIQFEGLGMPISVGFSNDDPHNVGAVESLLRKELAREFPGIRFAVYDTSEPAIPRGRKIVIRKT